MVAARKRRNIKFGEIAWLDLDPTRGNEQRGRSPVLVVSQNAYNKEDLGDNYYEIERWKNTKQKFFLIKN